MTYDYDDADDMTAIHENGGTTLASFGYDDLGRRSSRSLLNGTSSSYAYDDISRLTSLGLNGGGISTAFTLSGYNPASEIGTRASSNDSFAWTQGAAVSHSYTPNGLNQYKTIDGASPGYDLKGNLTSSGGVNYAYTDENMLKTAGSATLAYDPIGRLDEYDAPTTLHFVYDGGMISEELDGTGTIQRRYVFGPAVDEPIIWYEGTGNANRRYMDRDERGSVTRITKQDGSLYIVDSYDEYGVPASTNQGRFQYTGQAWLSAIGLAYYKARIYSPKLGRFMQTDPVGYKDGPNWYAYVHGDPVNHADPSGENPGDPFDSPEAAANDALNFINGTLIKENIEYSGSITTHDGRYYATSPIRGRFDNGDHRLAPGSVADYHTHGDYTKDDGNGRPVRTDRMDDEKNGYNSNQFSSDDIAAADRLFRKAHFDLKRFLGTPSGQYRQYDPATKRDTRLAVPVPVVPPPPPASPADGQNPPDNVVPH